METVEILNRRMIDKYGKYLDGRPLYHVVYSEDLLEKRWTDRTIEGFELLTPIFIEVKKYGQYIHNKYLIERLIEIPEIVQDKYESKLSYEPLWVFEDKDKNPLPPLWSVIEIVMNAVLGNVPQIKEEDPNWNKETAEVRLKEMEQILFGNETPVGDALAHKSGIIVP